MHWERYQGHTLTYNRLTENEISNNNTNHGGKITLQHKLDICDIGKDIRKRKISSAHGLIEWVNFVDMTILLRAIYRFNDIPIKTLSHSSQK